MVIGCRVSTVDGCSSIWGGIIMGDDYGYKFVQSSISIIAASIIMVHMK